MLARLLSSSVVLVILSLALSPEPARAEECPASIAAFTTAGHGLSGKEAIYLITLNVDPDVTNAEFVVNFSATGPNVTFDTPVTHNRASKFTGWSWLRLSPPADAATISLASVTKFGESQPCVPAAAQPTSITTSNGAETIYDDSHPHFDLADATVGHLLAADANFKGKVAPDYPEIAKWQNVMGTVDVEVEIGPQGGAPQRAWVRWAEATGESQLLADPSLYAANRSTFTAPIVDGRPQSRDYAILYTFSLGDGPTRFPSDDFDGCPLELVNARVAPPSGADLNAWYFFEAVATSGNVSSATIAVQDNAGRIARYPWPVALQGPTNEDHYSSAAAAFNWAEVDIKGMWVDQVTTASGVSIHCNPNVDEPKTIASAVGSTRFISGKALDILGLQPTPRSRFVHEVLPAYPKSADGTRAAGHVTVDTLVDATGHVADAFVTGSSGLNSLDAAAMNAALASTYQPSTAGAVRAYELTYRFVP